MKPLNTTPKNSRFGLPKRSLGVSLIETMIVLAIAVIIAAIALLTWNSVHSKTTSTLAARATEDTFHNIDNAFTNSKDFAGLNTAYAINNKLLAPYFADSYSGPGTSSIGMPWGGKLSIGTASINGDPTGGAAFSFTGTPSNVCTNLGTQMAGQPAQFYVDGTKVADYTGGNAVPQGAIAAACKASGGGSHTVEVAMTKPSALLGPAVATLPANNSGATYTPTSQLAWINADNDASANPVPQKAGLSYSLGAFAAGGVSAPLGGVPVQVPGGAGFNPILPPPPPPPVSPPPCGGGVPCSPAGPPPPPLPIAGAVCNPDFSAPYPGWGFTKPYVKTGPTTCKQMGAFVYTGRGRPPNGQAWAFFSLPAATTGAGWTVVWSGDCSGTGISCTTGKDTVVPATGYRHTFTAIATVTYTPTGYSAPIGFRAVDNLCGVVAGVGSLCP